MKKQCAYLLQVFAVLFVIRIFPAIAVRAATDKISGDLPYTVQYELGDVEFAPGDNITIQQVRGTSTAIATGETYSVEGTYSLNSRDEAELGFHATSVSNSGPTPIDPKQQVRIKKGTGSFHLVKTMNEDGYLHVSFYSGNAFGGVYFGQREWVLHNKEFRHPNQSGNGGPSEKPVSVSGPNQVLLEYLGNPVDPPTKMDARYTKEGLSKAVELAAENVGITLKKIVIDDSEYPFLVGVICGESDYTKLTDEIKKTDGYNYNGSIGSSTCHAFNIIPYRAYPPRAFQRITHRAWLRQQIFYDKLHAQE